VTKKDIVKTIAADADLTQLKVKEIVQRTFDEIIETLVRDGKIELRNFGVFKVTKRAARPARNPRTSAPVYVPEKCVVTFKPGKEMAGRIRELKNVPDKEAETGLGGAESLEAAVASSIESLAAAPATAIPSTLSPPTITPASPANPEMGTSDAEPSFNPISGE